MPIPGIRGMEHVGITVPDIDEACDFFTRILGAEVLFTAAKDFRGEGDWMHRHLNVHPRAVIKEFRYVRLGNGTNLEVFQYSSPDQRTDGPLKNSDIGGHHMAFYVDDMDAAITFLRENGVQVLGEPTSYTDGPNLGLTWCYFLAPWGLQLEVVSAPKGTTFDNEAKAAGRRRLFDPSRPHETLI
jgi:catechol 2,3-dioxygenase-like lactoylglutathione lyase family enzyme